MSSLQSAHDSGLAPGGSNAMSFDTDDAMVKKFILASLVFGLVGMLVGVILALQLAFWPANLDLPWTTFGRLRPLHTNAVIFAFTGNFIFAAIYYSLPRLTKTPMWSPVLSQIHFWGWQAIIVSAAITLPLGFTQTHEYAELVWPIDIAITLIWVVFAVNFFGTVLTRKVKHMYVAIWFYMSMVITIAVLHIVNNLALPATLTRSYPIYAGMTDALVQWWYGHNAVGFLLTTPILGIMYYFLPKSVNRPVFSYRLSIIHFWALVFIYIWAGPHHLLWSGLPDWAQTLGMVFSIMLIAPSWGGMLNGLLTLRGAWDRLRTDPIVKFWAVGVSFYGMSTFEGPMMSIRAVNSLSHYTDWTIGHVHGGALGWVGMAAFACFYYVIPKVWKTTLHSVSLATAHFWLATVGIVFYIVAMWASGITQGLMWRAVDEGGQLQYGNFMDTVLQLMPFYWIRLVGGLMYLSGLLVMLYNVARTIQTAGSAERAPTPALAK
ncbi:MAG: cytochrome-c oxidase, cbb3-type subunit [Pseudomonadota bacterium]